MNTDTDKDIGTDYLFDFASPTRVMVADSIETLYCQQNSVVSAVLMSLCENITDDDANTITIDLRPSDTLHDNIVAQSVLTARSFKHNTQKGTVMHAAVVAAAFLDQDKSIEFRLRTKGTILTQRTYSGINIMSGVKHDISDMLTQIVFEYTDVVEIEAPLTGASIVQPLDVVETQDDKPNHDYMLTARSLYLSIKNKTGLVLDIVGGLVTKVAHYEALVARSQARSGNKTVSNKINQNNKMHNKRLNKRRQVNKVAKQSRKRNR